MGNEFGGDTGIDADFLPDEPYHNEDGYKSCSEAHPLKLRMCVVNADGATINDLKECSTFRYEDEYEEGDMCICAECWCQGSRGTCEYEVYNPKGKNK